jgi:D-proline reductase (dithiol) PrdB
MAVAERRALPLHCAVMGDLNEFSLPVRLFLRNYPWRRIDPTPWTPLKKPLAECRLALISSAGFVLPGQPPFDSTIKGGDCSFREIPATAALNQLTDCHRSGSFDHTAMQRDPNLSLPLDRVRELAAHGRIGSVNHRHFSFMGSIVAPGRLVRDTAPEVARSLAADGVDVALLVPV